MLLLLYVTLRILFMHAEPFYEDDYYRYVWDGIVGSNIDNPLIIAPEEVLEQQSIDGSNKLRQALTEERSGYLSSDDELNYLLTNINYPESPSIYGPVAQLFLAFQSLLFDALKSLGLISDLIKNRIIFLQLIFLIVECLAIYVFNQCLIHLRLSNHLLYAFCFCPLLLKEVANSIHIDVLSMCLSLQAFLSCLRNQRFMSAFFLSAALCVKSYALVLVPIFFLKLKFSKLFMILIVCIISMFYMPFLLTGTEEIWAGTRYFSLCWSMNDFFTAQIRELLYHSFNLQTLEKIIFPIGNFWVSEVQLFSRLIGLGCFAILYLWYLLPYIKSELDESTFLRLVSLSLFGVVYFSPVQNPWYLLWGLPFYILACHIPILFLVSLSQFYLFNFVYEATTHFYHPFQWWVLVPHSFFIGFTILYFKCPHIFNRRKLISV